MMLHAFPWTARLSVGWSLRFHVVHYKLKLASNYTTFTIKTTVITHSQPCITDSPLSKRACVTAPLSDPWVLTEGATTASDLVWRDDTVLVGLSVRGSGVRGLAVDESESCTVTQLMTFVRWLRPTLGRQWNGVISQHFSKFLNILRTKRSAVSSPGRMELALILCVRVTMNSDDANCWTGCVGDYDWLGQHGAGAGWRYSAAAEERCCGYTPGQITVKKKKRGKKDKGRCCRKKESCAEIKPYIRQTKLEGNANLFLFSPRLAFTFFLSCWVLAWVVLL